MKKLNLIRFLVMVTSIISNTTQDELSRRLCLLEGQYYHPESTSCSDPFDEDHCEPGSSWLLPTSVPGEVQCQEIREDLSNCAVPGIDNNGEAYCINEEDTVYDEAPEQVLHRRASCPENKIMMPDNFMENTKPCPKDFMCSINYKNAFSFINKHYKNGETELAKKEKEYANSSLVCSGSKGTGPSTEPKMACVPNTGSLADNSKLLDSFKLSEMTCQDNPCPRGKWPWVSAADGFQRCLEERSVEEIQNCPQNYFVVEALGKLECQEINPIYSNIAGEKCKKRKIWDEERGRCRPRFFG